MTTMTAPISDQLAEAQRNATVLRIEFDQATGELAQAVETLDYERANTLKHRADELRPSVILAEQHVVALQQTARSLAEHDAQVHAKEREKARQELCDRVVGEAMVAERAAVAESERLLAEAHEGMRAVAATLRAAQAAEFAAGQHRQTAHQAQVDAGRAELSRFGVAMPNRVETTISDSPLYPELLRTSF